MMFRHIRPSDLKALKGISSKKASEYLSEEGHSGLIIDGKSAYALYRNEADETYVDYFGAAPEDVKEIVDELEHENAHINIYLNEGQMESVGVALKNLGLKGKTVKDYFGRGVSAILFQK